MRRQIKHRSLTCRETSARAMTAARLCITTGITPAVAAAQVGDISHATVRTAMKLIMLGDPEKIAAVDRGERTVHGALGRTSSIALPTIPATPEQRAILAGDERVMSDFRALVRSAGMSFLATLTPIDGAVASAADVTQA